MKNTGTSKGDARRFLPFLLQKVTIIVTYGLSVISHVYWLNIIFSYLQQTMALQITTYEVVPSTSRSREDESHVTLKLWKEGFNVNDGPLREYDDPENKQFLDSVRQGLIPPELTSNIGNATVQLNLEDHHHESFTSFRAPKIRPFTGQGHVLGRPTPALIRTNTEEREQPQGDSGVNTTFKLDESKPMTTIAIRLPDGRRLNGVFNHSHTVGDIRAFIRQTHPEFGEIDYSLQTTIPVQELKDNSVTVVKAELINSVLIMRLQK